MKHAWTLWIAMTCMAAGRVELQNGQAVEGDVRFADSTIVVQASSSQKYGLDQVRRVITRLPPQPIRPAATGGSLPPGWTAKDIGQVRQAGTTSCDESGLFNLTATGWGAWGPDDSFQFAWMSFSGDGQIMARIVGTEPGRGIMTAGVMIRQSEAADAHFAAAYLRPNGEVRLGFRPHSNENPDFHHGNIPERRWVRLTRNGNKVSAFASNNGVFWELVDTQTVPLADPVMIGLCAWARGNAVAGQVKIDSVQIIPGTPSASYVPGAETVLQGIALRDGNLLAGQIGGADDSGIRLNRAGVEQVIPWRTVAQLIFSPPPQKALEMRGKRGVLLTNGDFVEGEVTSLTYHKKAWDRREGVYLKLRSLLFGIKEFETSREVIAAVLADPAPVPAAYEVRTGDGSITRCSKVQLTGSRVLADEREAEDVVEIRRLN